MKVFVLTGTSSAKVVGVYSDRFIAVKDMPHGDEEKYSIEECELNQNDQFGSQVRMNLQVKRSLSDRLHLAVDTSPDVGGEELESLWKKVFYSAVTNVVEK